MKAVNIYLQFNGNCEEAFNFYKNVFQSEFLGIFRYRDIPVSGDMPSIPEKDMDKIENISMKINGHFILMGADVSPFGRSSFMRGNNFSIYLEAENKDEAGRIFTGLSLQGAVLMPLQTAHWGDLFGICTDRFGVSWMINFSDRTK